MNKITVIGSLNADLTISTPRIPKMGETVRGSDFNTFSGGKGANQAIAAARLGGNVNMVGCLGDDSFGKTLLQNLKSNGVGAEHVRILPNTSTGIAMIVLKDGDNFIIFDSGANYKFEPEQLDEAEEIIAQSDILMLQLEIPLPIVEKAVKIAKKHGVKVLLNPAPACPLPDDLLKDVDILTPNESECEFLTGMTIESVEAARKAVEFLMGKGVGQVVVTLGGDGAVYMSDGKFVHKPVPDVPVVDTTAAGDSFSAALAVAISNGKSIDEAVDFANMVANVTITKKGAQSSLPFLKEVEEFIKSLNA